MSKPEGRWITTCGRPHEHLYSVNLDGDDALVMLVKVVGKGWCYVYEWIAQYERWDLIHFIRGTKKAKGVAERHWKNYMKSKAGKWLTVTGLQHPLKSGKLATAHLYVVNSDVILQIRQTGDVCRIYKRYGFTKLRMTKQRPYHMFKSYEQIHEMPDLVQAKRWVEDNYKK